MKVLLYDSEELCTGEINNILMNGDYYGDLQLDIYEDRQELLKGLHKGKYMISYVVINNNSDLTVLKDIRDMDINVIVFIICQSKKYYQEAFRNKVFQYLTIPLDEDLFRYEFNRAIKEYRVNNKLKMFKLRHERRVFDLDEIIMIESYYNDTRIITTQGSFWTNRSNLMKIKKEIRDFDFICLQSGYIVNMNFIVSIKYREALLKNGMVVPISLTYFKVVKEKYMSFLENR